jgi:transcriptional regulator with XRE-family HTH domain
MQKDYDHGMKWNDRLRKARDDAGISNTDIAKACRVKPASVTGWLTGDTVNIEAHNLLAACKLLGVSPFWVMFGEADPAQERNRIVHSSMINPEDMLKLLTYFALATENGRTFILDSAEIAEKSIVSGQETPAANQA